MTNTNLKVVNNLYSDAVREMVKHCKHWGYDDSNDIVIDDYLHYMRSNGITLPEDVIEELEYTNINKNDYYRVFAELTYSTEFSFFLSTKELLKKNLEECIEEKLLDSLNKHDAIRSLKILGFDKGFNLSTYTIPLLGKMFVKCTGDITFASNNIYDENNELDKFMGGEHTSYSEWLENEKQSILTIKDSKNTSASIKTLSLKGMEIILDSSCGE